MNTGKILKSEWIFWLLILAPLVFALVKWDAFPDRIPIHWNVDGEVDNYKGKWALFLSPMINIALYFLFIALPKIDPRKKNYDLFSGSYWLIRIMLAVLISGVGFMTIFASLGISVDVAHIVPAAVVVMLLLLGNMFGRIRPNYFVGIRTPWTLNNETVWTKTHRFGGKVWVIASLLMLPLVFLLPPEVMDIVFFCYIAVVVVLPVVYSWKVHKKITAGNGN